MAPGCQKVHLCKGSPKNRTILKFAKFILRKHKRSACSLDDHWTDTSVRNVRSKSWWEQIQGKQTLLWRDNNYTHTSPRWLTSLYYRHSITDWLVARLPGWSIGVLTTCLKAMSTDWYRHVVFSCCVLYARHTELSYLKFQTHHRFERTLLIRTRENSKCSG